MLSEKGMMSYWRAKPVMDFTVMGLVPMLPSTEVAPVLVMPALVSRQKAAAVPRLMTARTGHGGCGVEGGGGVGATITEMSTTGKGSAAALAKRTGGGGDVWAPQAPH